MDTALLEATAAALVAPGKGILAADESNGTMSKRLEGVGLESSAEARRAYRANLFATPGCEDAISGVILYDETIRQNMDDGTPIPDYLTSRGIIPGIKVDTGTIDLEGCPGEKITKGIEAEPENGWADLGTRCAEYFAMGARFAKWRAVIQIEGHDKPSNPCMSANAEALARYAAICQDNGLVPIIEPEVLMDGSHNHLECFVATLTMFQKTFEECKAQGVHLAGTLLKPNMIIPGKEYRGLAGTTRDDVAASTVICLTSFVPHDVGGIVFLSGGQSDEEATDHLNRMNSMSHPMYSEHPWELSYSYGRALQAAALKAWAEDGAEASQAAFAHRAKMNSLARSGDWDISLE
ncbi:MAG: class I fructose-bisphosphate aldolase [Candidatus Thermoplasmatota archaeon]|nr:class I fructose-bisphosphate aldolase [Candidatus Thermoplasmatota archaeon]